MSDIPSFALSFPAGVPPEGVVPNRVNPENTGGTLIMVSSVLLVIMMAFVFNRIYVRTFIARKFTLDDATCYTGTILTIGFYAAAVYGVKYCHIGNHMWDITVGEFLSPRSLINQYILEVLVCPALGFIKVTFFILYLELFRPIRSLRLAIWFGGILTTVSYAAFTIAWFVLITPRPGESMQVHFTGPMQLKAASLAYPIPVVGLALDIYILVVPLVGIYRLQISKARKFGVAAVFLTAIIAVIASLLRIVYTPAITKDTFSDLTYNIMPLYLTVLVEMTLGVALTCMPACSKMLHHTLPPYATLRSKLSSRFGRSTQSRSKGASSNLSSFRKEESGFKSSYVEVKDPKVTVSEFEMARPKAVATYISGGGRGEKLDEDGVHLKYEMRQDSQESDEYRRENASRLPSSRREAVEKYMV